VHVHSLLWLEVFDAAIVEHHSQPLAARLHLAGRAIAAHIDSDPEPPRRAMSLSMKHPVLLSGFQGVSRRWVERIAEEACPSPATQSDRFRARVIGSATMGLVDATIREWLLHSEGAPFVALWDEGFAHLAGLLGPASTPVSAC